MGSSRGVQAKRGVEDSPNFNFLSDYFGFDSRFLLRAEGEKPSRGSIGHMGVCSFVTKHGHLNVLYACGHE